MKQFLYISSVFLLWVAAVSGCDTVFPGDPGTLVIEAYLDVGKPLPKIKITQAAPLSSQRFLNQRIVDNANVHLVINGVRFTYVYSGTDSGMYEVDGFSDMVVPAGATFSLTVDTPTQSASASGITPPKISIQEIRYSVSNTPVAAVLLDSLDIGLDSLNINLNTRRGFIYPVQVSIDWFTADMGQANWIETKLNPITTFSSTIVDYFLLPSAIFLENTALKNDSLHTWEGVYAVPVDKETDPLPQHDLRVALLRSNDSYAQFASSLLDPVGREPISNLTGAVGFVGGISVDSVRVQVTKQ